MFYWTDHFGNTRERKQLRNFSMNRGFPQGFCNTDIIETDLITASDFVFTLQKVNFTIKKICKPYKSHVKENS